MLLLDQREGLQIAGHLRAEEPLEIRGSLDGRRHSIKVSPTYMEGKRIEEDNVPVAGTILHYEPQEQGARTFPGTSGSLILDKDRVVGIHTTTHVSDKTKSLGFGHGWIIKGKK